MKINFLGIESFPKILHDGKLIVGSLLILLYVLLVVNTNLSSIIAFNSTSSNVITLPDFQPYVFDLTISSITSVEYINIYEKRTRPID